MQTGLIDALDPRFPRETTGVQPYILLIFQHTSQNLKQNVS